DASRPDQRVRAALAATYRAMGLHALAVDAYGDARTLATVGRRSRRRAWWRTGGPLRPVRYVWRRFDQGVLRIWRSHDRKLRALDELPWPPGFDPVEVRSRLDAHLLRWALLGERGSVVTV